MQGQVLKVTSAWSQACRMPKGYPQALNGRSGAMQGQVLNLTSAWWMGQTGHIVQNALLEVPHPNVSIMRRCSVYPVEVVVRGFMTGVPSLQRSVNMHTFLSSSSR